MSDESASDRRVPRNEKEAAVEQWQDALALMDGETEDEQFLLDADIHERAARLEIEEIIHHGDIDAEAYGALEDAFDDLRSAFDDVWE